MSNVMEMLKQGGTYLLGIAVLGGLLLFAGVMFAGATIVTAFLFPIVQWLAGLAVVTFLFVVLPASLFQPLRVSMAVTSMILSYVCGASVWMFSFLSIIFYLKGFALLALMFFQAVAPLACIVVLLNGKAAIAGGIILGLLITYGMRLYSIWIEKLYQNKEDKSYEIRAKNHSDDAGQIIDGCRICPTCYEKNNPALLSCWKCNQVFQGQLDFDANEAT